VRVLLLCCMWLQVQFFRVEVRRQQQRQLASYSGFAS
jgi:hypothetical protein